MKVKVNTSDRECWGTDEIVCPFCGAEQSDSWEYGNGESIGEVDCGACGRRFYATREIAISYTSTPLGSKYYDTWENGDVFEDGITDIKEEEWANENGDNPCEVQEAKE